MTLLAIAQSTDIAPLIQGGIPGVVLAWFMVRNERKMESVQAAVDRMSQAILLLIVSRSNDASVHQQASELLATFPKK